MQVVIVGAGGHGKVVLDILRAAAVHEPVGFVDADTSLTGMQVGDLPVFGPANVLPRLFQQKIRAAIVAIGDNRTRRQYAAMLRDQGFELVNAIHPAAVLSPTARLGSNIVICAGAILCAECHVQDSSIINTGAIVDHECVVGEAVHVAPAVCLAGRVQIEPAAFVGMGAQIIQCLTVGEESIVGAGAVVIEDVPAYATVVGVPARMIRRAAPVEVVS